MLNGIKSKYALQTIFEMIPRIKFLNMIKNSKSFQKKLDLTIQDYYSFYKEYMQIELEIIPTGGFGSFESKFMNIEKSVLPYFHCFFR